jgi:hypothetical protein
MEHPSATTTFLMKTRTVHQTGRKNTLEHSKQAPDASTITGNYLPFGKRPFGSRPLPALSQKPEHIFLIGRDRPLLRECQELLLEAGYATEAITPEEAIQESRKPQVSISVFCHSLTSVERVQLAASFRRYNPEARLLLVSQRVNLNFEVMLFHCVVTLEDGPAALIEGVNRLVSGRRDWEKSDSPFDHNAHSEESDSGY